jgi:hypothetical protein
VEKVAAYGEKANQDKVNGRAAQALMGLIAPIAMKLFMKPEKMFGWLHRHHIDWEAKVTA